MILILKAFLIFFATLPSAFSKQTNLVWSCIDIPTCNLLKRTLPKENIEQLFVPRGDPHQFSPSAGEVKALLTATQLALPPRELAPWSQGLKQKRQGKTTIELKLKTNSTMLFKGSAHDLAHYWLYPQLHCQIWDSLTTQVLSEVGDTTTCPFQQQGQELEVLKNKIASIPAANRPQIIITHEGVGPLLSYLGLDYLSLKAGHHGANTSPSTLKKLAELEGQQKGTKAQKLLIIEEPEISVQGAIAQKLQKLQGERLKWQHLGQLGADPLQALQNLLDFLRTHL